MFHISTPDVPLVLGWLFAAGFAGTMVFFVVRHDARMPFWQQVRRYGRLPEPEFAPVRVKAKPVAPKRVEPPILPDVGWWQRSDE